MNLINYSLIYSNRIIRLGIIMNILVVLCTGILMLQNLCHDKQCVNLNANEIGYGYNKNLNSKLVSQPIQNSPPQQ